MKKRINIKNLVLVLLAIINFLLFVASVSAMIEVEVSYIPLTIMGVSGSVLSLFLIANIDNIYD